MQCVDGASIIPFIQVMTKHRYNYMMYELLLCRLIKVSTCMYVHVDDIDSCEHDLACSYQYNDEYPIKKFAETYMLICIH